MSYPKVVQQIHHAYNTASENALKEAQEIINSNSQLLDKASKLEQVGFINSHEVHKAKAVKMSKEIADLVLYYQINYPDNKFITEAQVESINKKYKLVCAPIDRYKGFVPANKLEQVRTFSIKRTNDLRENKCTNVVFAHKYLDSLSIKAIKKEFPKNIYPAPDSYGRLRGMYLSSYDIIPEQGLFICAPSKDMDLKGLSKIGALFQSLITVTVPDPIVLQPVKGGFLIVAAWGDEASDEIVVNQQMN